MSIEQRGRIYQERLSILMSLTCHCVRSAHICSIALYGGCIVQISEIKEDSRPITCLKGRLGSSALGKTHHDERLAFPELGTSLTSIPCFNWPLGTKSYSPFCRHCKFGESHRTLAFEREELPNWRNDPSRTLIVNLTTSSSVHTSTSYSIYCSKPPLGNLSWCNGKQNPCAEQAGSPEPDSQWIPPGDACARLKPNLLAKVLQNQKPKLSAVETRAKQCK